AVEVEGRVREDLRDRRDPQRAHARVAARDEGAGGDEERERLEVGRVDEVGLQPAQGGARRGEQAVAAGEVRAHEVAVLAHAADARAEAVAEAPGRAVAERIVEALRGGAPRARGGALVGEEEQGPREGA